MRNLPVLMSCAAGQICAPVKGRIVSEEEIPDDFYSIGFLGATCGVFPEEGILVSPFDGRVLSIAEEKHAISLEGPGGMLVLVHVGIGTVRMKGDGFCPEVSPGKKVRKGQLLMTFDREKIAKADHSDCVVVILSEPEKQEDLKVIPGKNQGVKG